MKTLLQPLFGRSSSSPGKKPARKMSGRQHDAAAAAAAAADSNTLADDQARPDKMAQAQPAAEVQQHSPSPSHPPVKDPVQGPVQVPMMPAADATSPRPYDLPAMPPPPSSSGSTRARVRGTASQLHVPTVLDEGYDDGAPSCSESHVAPPSENNGGQNEVGPAPAVQRTTSSRLSWFRHTTPSTDDAMAAAATLRHKPSFRDRFWSASSSNDFGDRTDSASPRQGTAQAPTTTTPSRAPYVPRHAAADFARTTNTKPVHHRPSASWDSSSNYTHRPPPPPIDEENPFTDSHETDTLYEDTYPPAPQHRSSSDYEQFLAHAAAEERAQRVQAARRSWRHGGEGSRRDSAYYSAGGRRGGSARTSEDGSRGSMQRASPEALAEARSKRHSRAAQMVAEYIKPPREEYRVA